MVGWGGAGLAGAALAALSGRRAGRLGLAAACGAAGLAFGAWMDLYLLMTFSATPSVHGYVALAGISLPFNVAHAIGNAALALAFGPAFVRVLERSRRRLDVRWEPAAPRRRAARGIATATLAAVLLLAAPAIAAAADPAARAVRYLERAQNRDGGFGAAPRQGSSQLVTGWAVLGLEAAGRHPLDVVRGGRTPIDFMRARAAELNDTGELERTVLAVRGAGLDARAFAGRDLVAELLRRRRGDGSFAGLPNWTAFGIMALRAAGRGARSPAVSKAARWLAGRQGADGGYSVAGEGSSFVDETGAVLQGLAAARRARGSQARRALRWLRSAQNPDGGFGQAKGHASNSQSTAWAIQGILAARAAPSSFRRGGRTPAQYLRSLQQRDGSFRYSRSSAQTPVWVTGQVVAALQRKTFPLRPPRRRARAAAPAAAARPPAARPRPRAAGAGRNERPRRERVEEPGEARPVLVRRAAARTPAGAAPHSTSGDGGGRGPWIAGAGAAAALSAAAALAWARRRRA